MGTLRAGRRARLFDPPVANGRATPAPPDRRQGSRTLSSSGSIRERDGLPGCRMCWRAQARTAPDRGSSPPPPRRAGRLWVPPIWSQASIAVLRRVTRSERRAGHEPRSRVLGSTCVFHVEHRAARRLLARSHDYPVSLGSRSDGDKRGPRSMALGAGSPRCAGRPVRMSFFKASCTQTGNHRRFR